MTLVDGAVYSNVRLGLNRDVLVLTILQDDRPTKNVSYGVVESIEDETGRDVTERLLAGTTPPGPSGGVSGAGFGEWEPARLPWKLGLTIAPDYGIPFGDWYEGLGSAAGVRAHVSVGVTGEIAIDFGVEYQPLHIDDSTRDVLETLLRQQLDPMLTLVDVDFTVMKFLFGARYLGKSRTDPVWGYGAFAFGAYRHGTAATVRSQGVESSADVHETEFGMNSSGGAIYMFSEHVGIDVGARFDIVYGTAGGSTGTTLGFLLEIGGGVVLGW